jgi:hypothetical protein
VRRAPTVEGLAWSRAKVSGPASDREPQHANRLAKPHRRGPLHLVTDPILRLPIACSRARYGRTPTDGAGVVSHPVRRICACSTCVRPSSSDRPKLELCEGAVCAGLSPMRLSINSPPGGGSSGAGPHVGLSRGEVERGVASPVEER